TEVLPGALARRERNVGQKRDIGFSLGTVDGGRVEARAATSRMIDHVDRKILAREVGRPTFAAIRRRLVGDAGVTRTMHHDDRRRANGFRYAVMDIHLVGHDLPGRKAHSVTRMAALGDLAADEE